MHLHNLNRIKKNYKQPLYWLNSLSFTDFGSLQNNKTNSFTLKQDLIERKHKSEVIFESLSVFNLPKFLQISTYFWARVIWNYFEQPLVMKELTQVDGSGLTKEKINY